VASRSNFPITHLSLVRRAGSADAPTRERARDALAAVYWAPIYTHIRLANGATREDAEDLTQSFFVEAIRRDLFARYEPERARFRTYVRTCVDTFVANARRAERRLKRGGALRSVPIDVAEIEERLAHERSTATDVDAVFQREWARGVLAAAMTRLRERYEAKQKHLPLAVFERYDIASADSETRPTYADLAAEVGVSTMQITNWLAAVRRDFRQVVLETLRELTGNDEEFRAEARALLGVDIS
jgi:RNA polymerase sigma factor (sigma-70 family)